MVPAAVSRGELGKLKRQAQAAPATNESRRRVADADNIGLDRGVGGVGGVARGHEAFWWRNAISRYFGSMQPVYVVSNVDFVHIDFLCS